MRVVQHKQDVMLTEAYFRISAKMHQQPVIDPFLLHQCHSHGKSPENMLLYACA